MGNSLDKDKFRGGEGRNEKEVECGGRERGKGWSYLCLYRYVLVNVISCEKVSSPLIHHYRKHRERAL